VDDKPDSVVNGHSSTSTVASKLLHATRSHSLGKDVCSHKPRTACACTRWGLPCHACHQARGALLPHLFTLACEYGRYSIGGLFSVALSLTCNQRSVDVIHHRALPCPDFPRVSNESKPATVCPHAYCTPSSTLRTWQRRNQISLHGLHQAK